MPESRHLSYKFQRLREAIRESIAAGELAQRLPGERELAREWLDNALTLIDAKLHTLPPDAPDRPGALEERAHIVLELGKLKLR